MPSGLFRTGVVVDRLDHDDNRRAQCNGEYVMHNELLDDAAHLSKHLRQVFAFAVKVPAHNRMS
jgi:hypothetical protein